VVSNERRKRYRLRRAECCVPTRSMFASSDFVAVFIDLFSRFNRANQLLASVPVLSGHQPFVLFASDFAFQSPLLSQSAIPLAMAVDLLAAQRQTEHSFLRTRGQPARAPRPECERALRHRSTSNSHEDFAGP